jgi:hypothetical protein
LCPTTGATEAPAALRKSDLDIPEASTQPTFDLAPALHETEQLRRMREAPRLLGVTWRHKTA